VRRRASRDAFDCALCRELLDWGVSLEHGADFDTGIHDYEYEHASDLYRVAAPVDAVYSILAGTVKIVKPGPAGEQRIVRVLKTGDVAEIESIFSDAFEHTAIAVGKVRACRIPIAWLRKFVAGSGRIQMRLLQKSLTDLREAETWLSQLTGGATPARTRMARLMLRLRVDAGDRIHRYSIDDMGDIMGITPETVSRIISEFCRQGIVARTGSSIAAERYFRGDIAALERIAQEV